MTSHAPPSPRTAPTAGSYAGLALCFVLLAVYGSLVPFQYQPLPLSEAVSRFQAVLQAPVRVVSRSDWLANVLLFIPLGYLLTAALAVDCPRAVGVAAAALVVPCCGLLSAAVEFLQLFFPPRVSSLNDVVAESAGAALGALAWVAVGQALTDRSRRAWGGSGPRGAAAWLFPAYLAALLLVQLLPLDLTLSPAELYHKYLEGRVRPLPWAGPRGGPLEAAAKDLSNAACYLPWGLLLAALPSRRWRQGRRWPLVLGLGVGLAAAVEFLRLFVYSRSCDATDVITGGLAALAGWGLGLTFCPVPPFRRGAGAARLLALAVWAGALAFLAWQPFDFRWDAAAGRLRDLSLVPFADYYQGDYLQAFAQALHKTFLFLPVGALLAAPGRRPGRVAASAAFVLPAALALATVLEAGQCFLPTRYPSVTDVLVSCLGAGVGLVLAHQGPGADQHGNASVHSNVFVLANQG